MRAKWLDSVKWVLKGVAGAWVLAAIVGIAVNLICVFSCTRKAQLNTTQDHSLIQPIQEHSPTSDSVVAQPTVPWPLSSHDAVQRAGEEHCFEVLSAPPPGIYSYHAPVGFTAVSAEVYEGQVYIGLQKER